VGQLLKAKKAWEPLSAMVDGANIEWDLLGEYAPAPNEPASPSPPGAAGTSGDPADDLSLAGT
jgi:hypothetical protein